MATNVSSTTLAEIDIVFVWFDLYKPSVSIAEVRCDFMFNNTAPKKEILDFLRSKYKNQGHIKINKIER